MKFESMKDWRTRERDAQVFAIETVYIKIAGDFVAGCVLSQIDYWFKPTADGSKESRGGIERDGYTWLVKKRAEYEEWIGLKPKELDTALNHLRRTGLIVTASHFFKDAGDTEATKHLYVRINDPVFVECLNRIAQSGEVQASKSQTQDISSKSPNQDLQTNSPTEDLSASPNPQTRIYKPSKSPNREDKILDYDSEITQTEITGLAATNSAAPPAETPAAKPSKPKPARTAVVPPTEPRPLTDQQALVGAVAEVTGFDLRASRPKGRVITAAGEIGRMGGTAEEVRGWYGPGTWWYSPESTEFQGREKGDPPTPEQIVASWGRRKLTRTAPARAAPGRNGQQSQPDGIDALWTRLNGTPAPEPEAPPGTIIEGKARQVNGNAERDHGASQASQGTLRPGQQGPAAFQPNRTQRRAVG